MILSSSQTRPASVFHVGLDLGLRHDPTAVAVLEDVTRPTGVFDYVHYRPEMETALILRDVLRLPLETPYADLPAWLDRYLGRLAARSRVHLAVDAGGVGVPVVELLERARLPAQLQPIVITGGQAVGHLPHATTVPREMLLHNIRITLETDGLRIPAGLPLLSELKKELRSLGEPSRRTPDDMAFALALALWSARPRAIIGERSESLPIHLGGPKPLR